MSIHDNTWVTKELGTTVKLNNMYANEINSEDNIHAQYAKENITLDLANLDLSKRAILQHDINAYVNGNPGMTHDYVAFAHSQEHKAGGLQYQLADCYSCIPGILIKVKKRHYHSNLSVSYITKLVAQDVNGTEAGISLCRLYSGGAILSPPGEAWELLTYLEATHTTTKSLIAIANNTDVLIRIQIYINSFTATLGSNHSAYAYLRNIIVTLT